MLHQRVIRKLIRRILATAVVMIAASAVHGAITIDDFSGPVAGSVAVDPDPGLATVATAANSVVVPPGGWRIIRVNRVAGGVGTLKSAGHLGQLKYHQTETSRGVGSVWWDGDSNEVFADGGFPAVDLTEGGANRRLVLTKFEFQNSIQLTITVKTTTGTRTYVETLIGPPFSGFDKVISFDAFTGTGSFTSVTAIRVTFDGSASPGSKLIFDSLKAN